MKLYEPESYVRASDEERARVCNGAGPAGRGWLVPDTLYGLSITAAANVHDWMYHHGRTPNDKAEADLAFLRNMVIIILLGSSSRALRWLRMVRACTYFLAVWQHGQAAFDAGKADT